MAEGWQYNVEELRGRPLGRVLVRMGKLKRDQVHEALDIQREKGGPLGRILTDLGYIDEPTLTFALAFQAGMEYVDLEKLDIPEEVIKRSPPRWPTPTRSSRWTTTSGARA